METDVFAVERKKVTVLKATVERSYKNQGESRSRPALGFYSTACPTFHYLLLYWSAAKCVWIKSAGDRACISPGVSCLDVTRSILKGAEL